MRWKLNVAGGRQGSETEQRDRNRESENRQAGSGSQGDSRENGGSSMRQNTNAVGYPQDYMPHPMEHPQMDGSRMVASNYPSQNNGSNGGYSMFMPGNTPQNREMGFLAPMPEWEDGSGRGGRGTRSEEYLPDSGDVEARRRRSRRTGRFIRGEGDDGPEMHHRKSWEEGDEDLRRGSYSKHDDDDGQVEHLHREIKKLKQRLEESEDAQEHVHMLKREIKHLKGLVEELQESGSNESREKNGGKEKKKRGKSDEKDDEDEPGHDLKKLFSGEVKGKEFLRFLPQIFQDAVQVIENPPDTWPPYLKKQEYAGIYEMESKELLRAIQEYRAGEGTLSDVLREAEHALASAVQLKAHLLQADLKHGSQE